MRPSPLCAVLAFALVSIPAGAPPPAPDTRPLSQQPYLGLTVRDSGTPGGAADAGGTGGSAVVGWVYPGPLGGVGFTSVSGIRRSDALISVTTPAGTTPIASAADFTKLIASLHPGEIVTLTVRRSATADPGAAVPFAPPPAVGDQTLTFTATLSNRDEWSGTIGRPLRPGANIPEPAEGQFESMILAKAAALNARNPEDLGGGGLDALLGYLAKTQNDALDTNSLPAVVSAFRRPLSLDATEKSIAALVTPCAGGDPTAILALIAGVLDGPAPSAGTPAPTATVAMDKALAEASSAWGPDARDLVRRLRDNVDIYDENAGAHLAVIRRSPATVQAMLASVGPAMLSLYAMVDATGAAHAKDTPLTDVPPSLRAAVKGDILFIQYGADGRPLLIVGGAGPNEYDMDAVDCVYDVGGDDIYRYSKNTFEGRVVIDISGNDLHESTGDFAGPAVGCFGFSILDDRAGDDIYRSTGQFSIGAGLFGIGILIDRSGNDRYENLGPGAGWAEGVGFYGAGVIVDVAGSDTYLAERLSQGVGGPRGFGCIIDGGGNDLYRANGPTGGSAYGTPAVFLGMSQGFGYGIRGYAAGGVGAIYDLGGDDRYEAGEFSQAGGYYFGLGILHDYSGNDLYYSNRYGSAFAAHQAAGILIDDAGDDTYWSMTAASQSGAWDQSITMLIDRAGDDTYRCDGLGQGAAAEQALAVFLDLDGADHYINRARGAGAGLGVSGGNEYHYNADKVFSFSAFFDLGGKADIYPAGSGRANGAALRTGTFNAKDPQSSGLHGIFVDE